MGMKVANIVNEVGGGLAPRTFGGNKKQTPLPVDQNIDK
jgi:hypothetical protein